MPYSMKVDLTNTGQDEVQIDGLGIFKDGVTYAVTDELAAQFEALHGVPLMEAFVPSETRAGNEDITVEEVVKASGPAPATQLLLPTDDYENWKVADLDTELGERELAKSGNKADKVQRLRDYDAEHENEGSED